jgi:hypothetical protein
LERGLAKSSTLRFKVSEKGAVSVYGLGRFPATLYFEQWNTLLSYADELRLPRGQQGKTAAQGAIAG